jgi:H/ACA ribonucleoprotein complex subunit 4
MSAPAEGAVADRIREGAFLLVDKPRGPSSHQVTAWARDLLGVETAGHAGTLDPNVSGVLWVAVGPALKLMPLVLQFPKRYVGVIALHGTASDAAVRQTLEEFRGPIYQTPPVRSAVKRVRRVRTIYRFDLLERNGTRLLVDVVGDSGTYVRTLAVDVGDALGVGGNLEELRRTGTGPYGEAESVPLATLADAVEASHRGDPAPLLALLHPMEDVYGHFPRVVLRDSAAAAVVHGAGLASGGIERIVGVFHAAQRIVLATRGGKVVAFGRALVGSEEARKQKHGWVIDPERVLADVADFPPTWRRAREGTSPGAAPADPG